MTVNAVNNALRFRVICKIPAGCPVSMASNLPWRSGRDSTLCAICRSLAGDLTRNIDRLVFWLAFLLSLHGPLKRRSMRISDSTNLGDRDPVRNTLVIERCAHAFAPPSGVSRKAVGTIHVKLSNTVAQSLITERALLAACRLEAKPGASLGSGSRPARADDPWCHSTSPLDRQEPNRRHPPIACYCMVAPCHRPNGALTHADRPTAVSYLRSHSPIRGTGDRQPARSTAGPIRGPSQ